VSGCETRRGEESGRLAVRRPTDGALLAEPETDGVGWRDGTDSPIPEDSIIRPVFKLKDPAIFLSWSSTCALVIGARGGGRSAWHFGELFEAFKGEGEAGFDWLDNDEDVEGICEREACTA